MVITGKGEAHGGVVPGTESEKDGDRIHSLVSEALEISTEVEEVVDEGLR